MAASGFVDPLAGLQLPTASGGHTNLPKPSSTPLPLLTDTDLDQLEALIEHYQRLAELAQYSIYHHENYKAHLLALQAEFKALKERLEEKPLAGQARVLPLTLALKVIETSLNKLKSLSVVTEVWHFGGSSKTSKNNKEYLEANPKIPYDNDFYPRTTSLKLKDSANAELELKFTEKLKDETKAPSPENYVSVSDLVPASASADNLNFWARASVTSFFAGAPKGTNTIHFDDGYSPAQLAAVVSYCKFMNLYFALGAMQKIRLFAQDAATTAMPTIPNLTNEIWEKIKKNEIVTLDAAVQTELLKLAEPVALNSAAANPAQAKIDAWQDWSNTQDKTKKDTRMLILGDAAWKKTLRAVDAIKAFKHPASTTASSSRNNTSHSINTASSSPSPQLGGGGSSSSSPSPPPPKPPNYGRFKFSSAIPSDSGLNKDAAASITGSPAGKDEKDDDDPAASITGNTPS